jgi:phosphatidylglycerophosphate synthase
VWATVRDIYRQSKKRNDNVWTEWVSRPPAALLVWALRSTRVTPNQVSFAAITIAAIGCATLIGCPGLTGLVSAGLLLQLAYVVDCVDGQLARLTGQTSPAGALLDFLLDEVKALLVIGSAAVRLFEWTSPPAWAASVGASYWLLVGILGLFAAGTGMTLTSFMRRPEYLAAVGAPPIPPATDRAGFLPARLTPLSAVEATGRFVLHYPSWFLFICAFDRLDLFLHVYVGAHLAYLGRSSLILLVKLGRSRRPAPSASPVAKESP